MVEKVEKDPQCLSSSLQFIEGSRDPMLLATFQVEENWDSSSGGRDLLLTFSFHHHER